MARRLLRFGRLLKVDWVGPALLFGVVSFALVEAAWLELSLYEFRVPAEPHWRAWPFAGNVLLLCGYTAIWLLAIPRAVAALSVAALPVVVLGLANAVKVRELGEPILVFDLFQLRSVPALIAYVPSRSLCFFAAAVTCTTVALLTVARGRSRVGRSPTLVSLLLTMVIGTGATAASLSSGSGSWANRLFESQDIYWDPLQNHRTNGFALASLLGLPHLSIRAPQRYEEGRERDLLQPFLPCDSPDVDPSKRPSVVVTMLESFWDPTADGLAFDRDPLPFIRQLRSRAAVQHFVSPVFGGGTANAEFEVLTGLSTRFSPPGSVPYLQYVKRPMRSIASAFREHGYRTVAIHNFRRRFWNRDTVYPNLGFDEYVSLEDLGEVPFEFGWPSDAAVFDRVRRILDETDRPTFVFAVTVAMHGPYAGGGLRPTVALVDASRPDLVEPMSVYASKLALLDRHFQEFLEQTDLLPNRPIVVAFADHLPSVAAGALEPDSDRGLPRSRVVEALILGGERAAEREPRSLNCLGPEILRLAGIQPPPFFRFVENVCRERPVVTPLGAVDQDESALDGYRWLSYDRLFGAGYSNGVCNQT